MYKVNEDDIQKAKDEELIESIGHGSAYWYPKNLAEMIRRLKISIDKLNETTSRYSKILIWLTMILGILAGIQIYLMIKG